MASSGSSRAGSPIVAVTTALAVSASVHAGGQVLWDNGDTDGSGAYSNAIEEVFGSRRTLLDDFVVPDGEWWRIVHHHHTHIWNTLPAGSGEGMEICLRTDDGDRPGDVIEQLVLTDYEEIATGRQMFDRPEAASWATFEPVVLGPGTYWIEATIVGPENNFWLHRRDIRENECWVNYDDLGGLQPGSYVFGQPVDLNWQISGTIQSSACPEDLDDSGAVDFADLLAVLAAWGLCPNQRGCPEDLDGNGIVDFGDLLILLAAWGPCE